MGVSTVILVLFLQTVFHITDAGVCDSSVTELLATDYQQVITFPGSQNISHNYYKCKWRIKARDAEYQVKLVIQYVILYVENNCNNNGLTIYNGYDSTDFVLRKECRNKTESETTTSGTENVFVEWKLENNLNNRFIIQYKEYKTEIDETYHFNKKSVAALVAGIILALLFLGVVIGLLICCCRTRGELLRQKRSGCMPCTPVNDVPYRRERDTDSDSRF